MDHKITRLAAGQVFGEEAVLFKDYDALYTVTVSSEKAELWTISELEMKKRFRTIPETRDDLKSCMQQRGRLVYATCKAQPAWSLPNWEAYSRFYVEAFYKERNPDELIATVDESPENKQVIQETRVFRKQYTRPQAAETHIAHSNKEELMRQQKVQRNLELLHAKVDDIDMINSAVDLHPMQRGDKFMPQMQNKKRYAEVQRVVSPDVRKGQKSVELFKEDAFMKQTLAESAWAKKIQNKKGAVLRPESPKVLVPGLSKKAMRGLAIYDRKLNHLKNIHGGGSLVNGRIFD